MKPQMPTSSFLPSLPLEERLQEWFRKGRQVNRFDALMHLDRTIPEEDFLNVLEHYAFLVQGVWVTKSSLICEGHEAQLRDYILFLFSENLVIKKSKLRGLKVNDEFLRRLLRPFAYERPSLNNWKFREERDLSFIKRHLEIVKEQESAWSTRGKHLTEYLSKAGRVQPVMANKSQIQNMAKPKTAGQKVDTGSNKVDYGSESLMTTSLSNENRESLKKALLHVLRDRSPRSINTIRRELRDYALSLSSRPKEKSKTKALVNAIAITASGPSGDLLSVLKEVTVEIHTVYVLQSGEHPAHDPFRDVVIGLLRSKGPNAKLKKQEIVEAAKVTLKRSIPDSEYRQVLNELCVHDKGAWTLKGVDKPQ